MLVKSRLGMYFYENKEAEVTTLLATGPEHLTTWNKNSPQRKGVSGRSIGRHTFETLFGRDALHNPNGLRSTPVDPYPSRGYWKAGAMAFKVVRIGIRHRPSRWYETPGSPFTVTS